MYGLEGILGNLVTSVATPAIGGAVGSMVSDTIQDEFLKQLTETTTGMLAGAATGAGIGALTGGKSGALSGAITGGIGGGVGGYNAPEVANLFGLGSMPQQSVVPPQGGQVAPVPQSSPMPPMSQAQRMQNDPLAALYPKQTPAQMNAVSNPVQGAQPSPIQDIVAPTSQAPPAATPTPQPTGFKGYVDFLKKNYEPLAGGFYLGSAYGANQDTEQQAKELKERMALAEAIEAKRAQDFARSVYAPKYADGGPVEFGLPATGAIPEVHIRVPAWMQEDTQRAGGLAALQPGIRQGMAQGGYINLQPMGETAYPQSQIPRAQPYAAASPQRREVVQGYDRGGLIDGEGDGMSDDIDAHIEGQEPVKVADGEYLIPKEIAAKYGPEKLKAMMTKVRAAAHAKKGKQVIQDAGKRAFISSLGGVRA